MGPLQTEHLPEWVGNALTSEMGLLVLFVLAVLEGAMLLRFMPSELLVPAAIALVGHAAPVVVAIVLVAVVGTTIGQAVLFVVVRRGGREYVLTRDWIPVDADQLARFDGWFERWGLLAVPVSNTLLFVRGLMTFPAGLSGMRLGTFVSLSALGSLCFQSILAALYLAGRRVIVL